MRLVTLNLRHGGAHHLSSLLESLLEYRADVLTLTEFRNNAAGAELRARLAADGFSHQAVSHGRPARNAVLIAARAPFRAAPRKVLRFDAERLLSVRFEEFFLVGVHMPNLKAKQPHWLALLELAARERKARRVLLGDFNTGHNHADGNGFRFTCEAEMGALEAGGWVDAWRHLHPQGREYSWYSHKGRGFRLDHAFLSPALGPSLRHAAFDHAVRERGYSDHSALAVDLEI